MNDDRHPDSARRTAAALRSAAVFSGAGLTLAGATAIGALGGNWLDARWGTAPWLLIIGFVLGTVAGFTQLLRMVAIAGRK